MKLSDVTFINIKKLENRTGKAMFLIVPITVIMILAIVISSQANNFKQAMDKSVFGTIEDQGEVIQLQKEEDSRGFGGMGGGMMDSSSSQFTESDLSTIESISNVAQASLNSSLPVNQISTSDLFEDKEVDLSDFTGLDSSLAGLYTDQDFTYEQGQTIPIILNASSLIYQYEDWEGETEFTIDFNEMREQREQSREEGEESGGDPSEAMSSSTPVKSEAISYDKDDLIGTEFTIQFGGLEDFQSFKTEQDEGVMTMIKYTDEELAELETERQETIGTYWDYEKISTPLTYTMKVVGIIETENMRDRTIYIPSDFASQLMSDYVQNQLDALLDEDISTDLLDSTYTGLTYDGIELSSGSNSMFGGGGPGGGMMMTRPSDDDSEESETSYEIPGLVIELASDGSEDVEGIFQDANVYESAVKTGETINIKIASVYDRAQVVADVNEAGYAYQDVNDLDVFATLQENIDKITLWMTVGFIGFTIAVIILTMSKFVSESTKEIGIFRAIGITRNGIIKMFVFQAVIYTLVGCVIGLLAGVGLNVISAAFVNNWFDNLVTETIKESFNVVNQVDSSTFYSIDWAGVGIYIAALFVVTFVISLIPAVRASNVSPVEAIKTE